MPQAVADAFKRRRSAHVAEVLIIGATTAMVGRRVGIRDEIEIRQAVAIDVAERSRDVPHRRTEARAFRHVSKRSILAIAIEPKPLVPRHKQIDEAVGIDVSAPMRRACRGSHPSAVPAPSRR